MPFLTTYVPVFEVSKQITTLSDPINANTNPKSIPGAIKEYAITVTNTGEGEADEDTLILDDKIPVNTSLVVGGLSCGNAVQLIDGTPSSGLSCGTVEFSQDGIVTTVIRPQQQVLIIRILQCVIFALNPTVYSMQVLLGRRQISHSNFV